jgi:hypothetical protein
MHQIIFTCSNSFKTYFTSSIVHLVFLSYLLKIFLTLICIYIYSFSTKKVAGKKDDKLCCVLLWEFNIIPSPTSGTIRPPKLDILEDILNDLLLVNLDEPLLCNCIKQPLMLKVLVQKVELQTWTRLMKFSS